MRLRQVVLVARDLEATTRELCAVLGVEGGFRDPGVGEFGLHNVVIPVGDTFLEVVSPVTEGTTAGRYLERRGGDGGYMVIIQVEDMDVARSRVAELGIRVIWQSDHDDIKGTHLHPRDVGGAILSLDEATPLESWRWAGPNWRQAMDKSVVREITAAELQAGDPQAMARRWSEVLARPVVSDEEGYRIELDRGAVRFVQATDGRGEGVGGFDVAAADSQALLAAARQRNLPVEGDRVALGGVWFRFV